MGGLVAPPVGADVSSACGVQAWYKTCGSNAPGPAALIGMMSPTAGGVTAPSERDYYEILGLPPGVRGADVGAAYWRLVRSRQAGRTGEPRALVDLDELNEAAEVLGTPALRRRYDAERTVPAPSIVIPRRVVPRRRVRLALLSLVVIGVGLASSPAATRAGASVAAIPGASVTSAPVVFLGDSVTFGAGASSPGESYAQVVRRRLIDVGFARGADDVDSVISALGGQAVDMRFSQDIGQEPRSLIVVEVGAHSVMEDAGLPPRAFARGYGLMLDCLQGTGARVVVSTVPWLGWAQSDPFYARADERSAIIRLEAALRGIPVVDLWGAMKDRPELLSPDAFHPGDAGHLLVANLFWLQIEPTLHQPRGTFREQCDYDGALALRSSEVEPSARSAVP